MKIPVLLEPCENGYRARAGDPFCLSAEGKTTTEALDKLEKLLEERRNSGARIVYLDIPQMDPPMARWAGSLDPESPRVKEWEEAVNEYRKQRDAELDAL